MKRVAIGYLSYVTEKNKSVRLPDLYKSLRSLSLLDKEISDIISIDNSSISEVREALNKNEVFDFKFHYEKNFYDVALFYTTMWYARLNRLDYICFLYDDFIVYDDALQDSITFLDSNNEVSCVRIPAYDFSNQKYFDVNFTPKSINPDSVRHYNSVTTKELTWQGPFKVKNHNFYVNNWHYTSRPTIWRREYFEKILDSQGPTSKVLQGFESWACKAFFNSNLKTGVLDKGMVITTPVKNSARGIEVSPHEEVVIDIQVDELKKEFESFIK